MKNITITLDTQTAKLVRVEAAKNNKSLSRRIGDLLREHVREADNYERSMRRYLAAPAFKSTNSNRSPSREELYDRPVLRR